MTISRIFSLNRKNRKILIYSLKYFAEKSFIFSSKILRLFFVKTQYLYMGECLKFVEQVIFATANEIVQKCIFRAGTQILVVRVLVLTLLAVWKCMCKWLSYIQREDILKTTYESQRIASNFTSFLKRRGIQKTHHILK